MRKPKRMIFALAGLMVAAGTMLGTAGPASASLSQVDFIVNYGSGMCIEPVPGDDGNLGVNGLPIQQSWCDRSVPQQQWDFELIGRTTYDGRTHGVWLIVNEQTGMCLDDRDGRTADRSPVQQWTCTTASTTMQWTLGDVVGDTGGGDFFPAADQRAGAAEQRCPPVPGRRGRFA